MDMSCISSGGNDYENHQQPPFNSMNKMHKNSNTCPNQECKNRNHHSHHHSHNHENSNRNKNPPLNTDPNSNIAQYLQKYVNPPTNFFFDPLDLRSSNPNCLKFFIFIAACGTLGSLLLYGRVILPIPDLTASISLMENIKLLSNKSSYSFSQPRSRSRQHHHHHQGGVMSMSPNAKNSNSSSKKKRMIYPGQNNTNPSNMKIDLS